MTDTLILSIKLFPISHSGVIECMREHKLIHPTSLGMAIELHVPLFAIRTIDHLFYTHKARE